MQPDQDLRPRDTFDCTELLVRLFGPIHEKTCLPGFANNTGADQPAHSS